MPLSMPHAGHAHCPTCICHESTQTGTSLHPNAFQAQTGLSSSDDSIAKLDGRVETLRVMIRDTLRLRNSYAPISSLPMELLGRIFVYCRDTCNPLDLRWISVSQVSRAWRIVAIGHASLWSAPNFWYPELAREMVHRTRGTALDLRYVTPERQTLPERDDPLNSALEEVLRTPHRIRTIHVAGSSGREIQAVIVASAAFLKALSCTPFCLLLEDVQNARYPKLEVMHGTYISGNEWRAPLLRESSALRVLRLKGPCISTFPQIADVLDMLSGLPHLEELCLTECMLRFCSFADHVDRKIHLLGLKTLTIDGNMNALSPVARLRQHLELSSHCRTTIQCYVQNPEEPDLVRLRRAMTSLVEHALPPACSDLRIEISKQTQTLQLSVYANGSGRQDVPHHSLELAYMYSENLAQCLSTMAPRLAGTWHTDHCDDPWGHLRRQASLGGLPSRELRYSAPYRVARGHREHQENLQMHIYAGWQIAKNLRRFVQICAD